MRISDWSSDVCSSDLAQQSGLALQITVEVKRAEGLLNRHCLQHTARATRMIDVGMRNNHRLQPGYALRTQERPDDAGPAVRCWAAAQASVTQNGMAGSLDYNSASRTAIQRMQVPIPITGPHGQHTQGAPPQPP